MNGDTAEPVIGYLGPAEGPCISYVASPSSDPQKILANLVKTCLNPATTWRYLGRTWHLHKHSFSEAEQSIPEYTEGMSGYYAIDPERSRSGTEYDQRIIFFLFSAGTDPRDSVKIIDQTEKGALPGALAAAILAAHQAFLNGHTSINHAPAIFATVAQSWPVTGASTLTSEQIHHLACQAIETRKTSNRDLANIVPVGAFDRANFFLALAETAWCSHARSNLIKNHYWFPQLETYMTSIASAWLYLQFDPSFNTPFRRVRVNRGQMVSPAGWIQALEWDAHTVPATVFEHLRPQTGAIIRTDDLSLTRPLSSFAQTLAPVFFELLKQDLASSTGLQTQLRMKLPEGMITAPARDYIWSLSPIQDNEMWMGIENAGRGKFSFWWSPFASLSYGWLPGRLNVVDYLYWNVLFCGIWHDLVQYGEAAFPVADPDDRNIYTVRHWGTEQQLQHSVAWAFEMADMLIAKTKGQNGYPHLMVDLFQVHLQHESKPDLLGLSFFVLLEHLANL